MSILAIEIHDTGLRVMEQHSNTLLPFDLGKPLSPGFALNEDRETSIGHMAAKQASIQPLHINNRFWDQLNTEGSDELAFKHLSYLWQQVHAGVESVLFAVPSHMTPHELGILYGICKELHLPVKSFVASPITMTTSGVHLDIMLHRSTMTLIQHGDLSLSHSEPSIGWLALQRQWTKGIQNEFVRATRFDPMHSAESEQCLADSLPLLLENLNTMDTTELNLGGYTIHITQGMMSEWAHSLIAKWCAATHGVLEQNPVEGEMPVILSSSASQIPGLRRVLEKQLNTTVKTSTHSDVLRNLFTVWPAQLEEPLSGQVTYQTALIAPKDGEATNI